MDNDEFHYHELMDRLSVMVDIFENTIASHSVVENLTPKHQKLIELVGEAGQALANCYQEAGLLRWGVCEEFKISESGRK